MGFSRFVNCEFSALHYLGLKAVCWVTSGHWYYFIFIILLYSNWCCCLHRDGDFLKYTVILYHSLETCETSYFDHFCIANMMKGPWDINISPQKILEVGHLILHNYEHDWREWSAKAKYDIVKTNGTRTRERHHKSVCTSLEVLWGVVYQDYKCLSSRLTMLVRQ